MEVFPPFCALCQSFVHIRGACKSKSDAPIADPSKLSILGMAVMASHPDVVCEGISPNVNVLEDVPVVVSSPLPLSTPFDVDCVSPVRSFSNALMLDFGPVQGQRFLAGEASMIDGSKVALNTSDTLLPLFVVNLENVVSGDKVGSHMVASTVLSPDALPFVPPVIDLGSPVTNSIALLHVMSNNGLSIVVEVVADAAGVLPSFVSPRACNSAVGNPGCAFNYIPLVSVLAASVILASFSKTHEDVDDPIGSGTDNGNLGGVGCDSTHVDAGLVHSSFVGVQVNVIGHQDLVYYVGENSGLDLRVQIGWLHGSSDDSDSVSSFLVSWG
ncbi:hypothetical protein MA16_Dca025340 [Dendrobium catenatum]|uniref:Uncharacterized protein n=1 Tax=Dendrobium catenatum TaxID=906689 RepID=A0A2I0XGL4_9ASPA|nr:hypothetical protein MA16_Dca025340 [Dendrobium catenatum]